MNEVKSKLQNFRAEHPELFIPKFHIYLAYFFIPWSIGLISFFSLLFLNLGMLQKIGLFTLAAFGFYHAMSLTHEFSHAGKKKYFGLRLAWNALIGSWLCVPAFMYEDSHLDHHGKKFTTVYDSEYIPLQKSGMILGVLFLLANFVLPWIALVRFLILGPISYLHPKLRKLVWTYATFMGMKLQFKRRIPVENQIRRQWMIQEWMTIIILWTCAGIIMNEILPVITVFYWAGLVTTIGLLNGVRVFAVTHKYRAHGDRLLSIEEHLEETVEIGNVTIGTFLMCPIALQYHLTHHMLPDLPFHNVAKARALLLKEFSEDSFYHKNSYRSMSDGLNQFFKNVA